MAVGHRRMVAAVDPRLQVEPLATVVEGPLQHSVGIAQRVMIVQQVVLALWLTPHRAVGGIAVQEVEVAALQVEHIAPCPSLA